MYYLAMWLQISEETSLQWGGPFKSREHAKASAFWVFEPSLVHFAQVTDRSAIVLALVIGEVAFCDGAKLVN